jgi:hypothetical protein
MDSTSLDKPIFKLDMQFGSSFDIDPVPISEVDTLLNIGESIIPITAPPLSTSLLISNVSKKPTVPVNEVNLLKISSQIHKPLKSNHSKFDTVETLFEELKKYCTTTYKPNQLFLKYPNSLTGPQTEYYNKANTMGFVSIKILKVKTKSDLMMIYKNEGLKKTDLEYRIIHLK